MKVRLLETMYNRANKLEVHYPLNWRKINCLFSSEKTLLTVIIKTDDGYVSDMTATLTPSSRPFIHPN